MYWKAKILYFAILWILVLKNGSKCKPLHSRSGFTILNLLYIYDRFVSWLSSWRLERSFQNLFLINVWKEHTFINFFYIIFFPISIVRVRLKLALLHVLYLLYNVSTFYLVYVVSYGISIFQLSDIPTVLDTNPIIQKVGYILTFLCVYVWMF